MTLGDVVFLIYLSAWIVVPGVFVLRGCLREHAENRRFDLRRNIRRLEAETGIEPLVEGDR